MIDETQEPRVPFDFQMLMTRRIPWQENVRRVRVRAMNNNLLHFPDNPMGWVLSFRRLTGELVRHPIRMIRKIFLLDRLD